MGRKPVIKGTGEIRSLFLSKKITGPYNRLYASLYIQGGILQWHVLYIMYITLLLYK